MYNAHPYFSLKILGRKLRVIHSKIWWVAVPWALGREWCSPRWRGGPVFGSLTHRAERKITLVPSASQVLHETGTKGRCTSPLETAACCTSVGYCWGPCAVGLLRVSLAPGLIEHEGRDVVIALKTRQAIQTVIAKSLKHLSFLWSRGIIDKHEGIEMNKVVKRCLYVAYPLSRAPPPPLLL